MKTNKDFIKLFDLNVPNEEHFDYYINQLSKTSRFSNIYELYNQFLLIEGIDDFYEFKKRKSFEIIEFIKNTNAFIELSYDKNLLDLPTNKNFTYEEGVNYLSVDIKSANWVSLKRYDQDNQLGDNYIELLSKFDMPEIFSNSKYLRQFIFGNVNPKKQQKVQRNIIQNVVRQFSSLLSVECVKNDEVIFSFDSFDEIKDIISKIDSNVYKTKLFQIERVEDFRIDSHFDQDENLLTKEMVGVNAHQFYLKLKQYITKEKIDLRDLYFKQDGKLALWVIDNLKIEI
jgi:hypothetical protein